MRNLFLFIVISLLIACHTTSVPVETTPLMKWSETQKGNHNLIHNEGGQTLGYSPKSGVKILKEEGLAFKDLNKNGTLDPYEDWRLPIDTRAKDLATRLSIEEIAGLMLYSAHQSIPARSRGYFAGTYNGQPFTKGTTDPSDLTDQQKQFLKEDNLRHVLITSVQTPEIAAQWNNKLQAFCESVGTGIPANNSSDPRHGTKAKAEYNAAAGGAISMWPSAIGMAATFDPDLVRKFGEIASIEYRALGITTALSPQVDIATDPRWSRFSGTFGESPLLSAAMGQAYCDGFQTSLGDKETVEGWGFESVNAMVKHWPGGGSGESGRDAHYGAGKYAVYPGNNFDDHLIPFTQGAFQLKGKTKMAAAVMPYYTISLGQDTKNGENVGNAYNSYIINDLLRTKYKYDGVVCTDWGVTGDHKVLDSFIGGKSWGVENLTEVERHYKALMVGVDQFGGNNKAQPIIDAYQMGIKEIGEPKMRARMEQSAVRLLRNIFRVGVFENPYLDVAETKATVGKPTYMKAGYEAQLKSIVLLKNQNQVLPIPTKKTVYVPKRFVPASRNFLGMETPSSTDYPVNINLVKKYFEVTDNPAMADFAFVFIQNPSATTGYDKADLKNGGNGYFPISLQYNDYTATEAREKSLGGGDPLEDFTNRGYKNKTAKTANITDMELVKTTKAAMKGKPVIVSVNTGNPMVFSEIEKEATAILLSFGVQDQAILDILSGQAEPAALLPMQLPKDMSTVETQSEDVPFDMDCHIDTEGNRYNFGFGMNWKGIIKDDRVNQFANATRQNNQLGTYTLVVEGYDWGPAANKVILNLAETVSSVQKDDYSITTNKQAACKGEKTEAISGERTIVNAHVSDEKGNKLATGNHVTLVLSVAPTLA
ncbi:MAG: glycoside hydrolase family 3 N-terminal domain-containing protein, partial [Saprospiraceae bacterium]